MKRLYELNGHMFGANDPDFQLILSHAYEHELRPLCCCKSTQRPELYVAKISSRSAYELRRMPNAGGRHSSDCDHFEPPPGLSGLAQVQGHAIVENQQTQMVELKLDFALAKISGRALPTPKDTPADSVKSDGTKLTLRGLLHYLWHTAGLDKWYPAMAGKRTYGTVYKYLSQAAMGKVAKSQSLADLLFIPEPHDSKREAEIRSRRMLRMAQLGGQAGSTTKLGLIVGELYELRPAQFGHQAIFKGAMDCPFRVNDDLFKRMLKHFEAALSMWDQSIQDTHLMVIGTFTVDNAGMSLLHEVAVMNVTANWLPFESTYEKALLDALTQNQRAFWKCLRFNLPPSAPMANAVLTDTEQASALCILMPGAAQDQEQAMIKHVGDDYMPLWFWHAGEQEMPSLPVSTTRSWQ